MQAAFGASPPFAGVPNGLLQEGRETKGTPRDAAATGTGEHTDHRGLFAGPDSFSGGVRELNDPQGEGGRRGGRR